MNSESLTHCDLVGDGLTLNTVALNESILNLSRAGGGTIRVRPGRYLTGTIFLQSNVTLFLENGAVILGSKNPLDYPRIDPPVPSRSLFEGREFCVHCLIYARGLHDIAILGEGTIDAQVDNPTLPTPEYRSTAIRPYGMVFMECRRIKVRNITLKNTSNWSQDYLNCDGVLVDGITVENRKVEYNNDGIDIDGSRNVRIANCNFNVGDDGICLKAAYTSCENITIHNCIISPLCNGIKFGTASRGNFMNIAVSNCSIYRTGVAGIALEMVDGGILDGVTITNISMSDVGAPIFIRLGNRGKKWIESQTDAPHGILRNVIIANVTASLAESNLALASSITGLPGHPVENITISNLIIRISRQPRQVLCDPFQLRLQDSARIAFQEDFGKKITVSEVPEKPGDYPEYSMFGPLPAFGLFCRHAKQIVFSNCRVESEVTDYRSAFVFHDVDRLSIDGLFASSLPQSNPVLLLVDVTHALLSRCVAAEGTPTYLRLEGRCKWISLSLSDLSPARMPLSSERALEDQEFRLDGSVQ